MPNTQSQTDSPRTIAALCGSLAAAVDRSIAAHGEHFAGSAILTQSSDVTLEAGYRWANRTARQPFTTATIAQIGSLSKQFTAAMIAALALDGILALSDPLARFFPNVPATAANLTLHQLLTHTAGLPSDCPTVVAGGGDFDPLTCDELIHGCLALPSGSPGTFAYSNLGYSVLAAVVETVTGRTLEDELVSRFWHPLEMTHTGYSFTGPPRGVMAVAEAGPNIATSLRALMPADWHLRGNGGMQASAEDMLTWYRALAGGPGLTPDLRQTLLTPYVPYSDDIAYGYGWFLRTDGAGALTQVSHTGSDGTFYAAFVWRPQDATFLYLVTSSGDQIGAALASELVKLMLSHKLMRQHKG